MPYSKTTLSAGTSAEMKGLLDAALTASGRYTKVTNAYTNATRTYDVWLNDGTTDNGNGLFYPWYLVVATDTANAGRLYTGGMLEYDDPSKIAKKALRGTSTAGFVDANGYPLVSAGGAEMTFPLGNFSGTSSNAAGCINPAGSSHPTAAAAGNIMRVLVTGQYAWFWYGTTSASTHCQGVGTYQTMHGIAGQDAKPLAFIAHPVASISTGGGTVWQSPAASSGSFSRTTVGAVLAAAGLSAIVWTPTIGKVGASGTDMNYGSNYVGSRIHLVREAPSAPGDGGGGNFTTGGYSLGLTPADFLVFGRQSGCAIGDTVTVNGKVYESVSTPAAGAGLFINTNA